MDNEHKGVRLPLLVSPAEVQAIDAWRYANHIPSRNEALRRLIAAGLEVTERQAADAVSR